MLQVDQYRARNAARGLLNRRCCETWGLFQISWYLLDHYNKRHDMLYGQRRVIPPWRTREW